MRTNPLAPPRDGRCANPTLPHQPTTCMQKDLVRTYAIPHRATTSWVSTRKKWLVDGSIEIPSFFVSPSSDQLLSNPPNPPHPPVSHKHHVPMCAHTPQTKDAIQSHPPLYS